MSIARADPATIPDRQEREKPPTSGRGAFRPSWDTDGWYVWLGPTGAASHVDGEWDTTFGGHLALVRVREREPIGAAGAVIGAQLWTARGGGRIWADALVGTRVWRMFGLSAGPILELSDTAHPRLGASVGLWSFVGVAPYVRVGTVEQMGAFAELGIHIALPVFRR